MRVLQLPRATHIKHCTTIHTDRSKFVRVIWSTLHRQSTRTTNSERKMRVPFKLIACTILNARANTRMSDNTPHIFRARVAQNAFRLIRPRAGEHTLPLTVYRPSVPYLLMEGRGEDVRARSPPHGRPCTSAILKTLHSRDGRPCPSELQTYALLCVCVRCGEKSHALPT